MKYWYNVNGKWMKEDKAVVSVNDVGLQRGYGAVEVVRAYGGIAYRLADHAKRLNRTLKEMRLKQIGEDRIETMVRQGLKKNGLKDAVVKIMVTGGESAPGPSFKGRQTVVFTFGGFDGYPKKFYLEGVKAVPFRAGRLVPELKTLNYVTSVLGYLYAENKNAHEAIFVDTRGNVSEGMTSNLFIVRNGILYTPSRGILEGITRARTLFVARKILPTREMDFVTENDVRNADEIFITSSNREIVPVTNWDGKAVSGGVPGPWTKKLMAAYSDDVARECRLNIE